MVIFTYHVISGDPGREIRTQDIDAVRTRWDGSFFYSHLNLLLFPGELEL